MADIKVSDVEKETDEVEMKYNKSPEVEEGLQDYLEEESKYQDVIDYIRESDMMSLKYRNGQEEKELTSSQLKDWENMYGKIYISKVTDDPVLYIWRPLSRTEYHKLTGTAGYSPEFNWDDDFTRQKKLLETCMLFPKVTPDFLNRSAAGILPTLEKQVMYQSGFIGDQLAIQRINVIGG